MREEQSAQRKSDSILEIKKQRPSYVRPQSFVIDMTSPILLQSSEEVLSPYNEKSSQPDFVRQQEFNSSPWSSENWS